MQFVLTVAPPLNQAREAFVQQIPRAYPTSRLCLHHCLSESRVQQRFTILEVAAGWHKLVVPQRGMQPSIARDSEQLDPR